MIRAACGRCVTVNGIIYTRHKVIFIKTKPIRDIRHIRENNDGNEAMLNPTLRRLYHLSSQTGDDSSLCGSLLFQFRFLKPGSCSCTAGYCISQQGAAR